ncbi:MAG: prepilin-type N-terminal cleavage/methylation domain-containing protein [Campylobacteraceae bacterium]|jgi:prepilin-type N-terminal cleavage/methylation domain-containing protein|nr:prepilin-type N-terminal cleavage/methylation domain-containing protein [Campylobacteraceae bacterium]
MLHSRAFTLVELVFVIVAVGILAAVIVPRMQSSRLREAADQVVSHIRYTQHLAMMDDKFGLGNEWYKGRWQIVFDKAARTDNKFSYSIFSDKRGPIDYTGNADVSEIAKNPQDTSKLLSGGSSSLDFNDRRATKKMNLGNEYGISNVVFSNTCSISGSRRIIFDYLGRPMRGNAASYTSAYPANRLIAEQCNITLSDGTDSIIISIEPETGFAYIQQN